MQAYLNIQGNKGALTRGTDTTTMDGYSPERAANLVELIRERRYKPKPVRRHRIPTKVAGKMRPLGIPSADDKLVQEVVRMILERIYEPLFKDSSHGFRPQRSCHTALQPMTKSWTGTKWFIDIDIKGYFDNINHDTLMEVLKKRIEDTQFLDLIRAMLKAGYVEDWQYHKTYSGTPQGGIVSPPTKLQTFFFGVRIARVRIEPKHHIDVIPGHFHPLDQRPDEVPLARPVGGLQTVVEFGCNVLQTANHQRQFPLQSGLIRHRLALLLQPGEAWAHAGHPGLKCGLVHEAIRITVDQAGEALAPLAYLVLDGGQRRACG